jgi:hypothetical protein
MRPRLAAGCVLCATVFAAAGSAAPTGIPSWSLAEARQHLARTRPFTIVDQTQSDRPGFRIDIDSVRPSSVRGVGHSAVVRGVRTWRSFRFTGAVTDLLTEARVKVAFDFSPGPVRGVRVRAFRGPPPNSYQPFFPIRGAFYYGWFPEVWSSGGINPFTNYHPSLGFYDSGDPAILRRHVAALLYGGFDAGIWSWWGIGEPTDQRFPTALAVARPTPFRWAVYYEREGYGNPSVEDLRRDLEYIRDRYGSKPAYLHVDGRAVVFVYSADDLNCEVTDRWSEANPGGLFIVMKVFEGYADCPHQPDGWHQYGADFATGIARHDGYATTIMPGFWLAGTRTSPFPRDLERWRAVIREMVEAGDPFQLVVSFDEWGEGTAVESADEWATSSGYGAYLDVLHDELTVVRR